MTREVRRVPSDWVHPKDERGRLVPLRDHFLSAVVEWKEEEALFLDRKWRIFDAPSKDPPGYTLKTEPLPTKARTMTFAEWHGPCPHPDDYMPDWPDDLRTHLQMYETTTEGTPCSPVLATAEELARWCADNETVFADQRASYDEWLRICSGARFMPTFTKVVPDGP